MFLLYQNLIDHYEKLEFLETMKMIFINDISEKVNICNFDRLYNLNDTNNIFTNVTEKLFAVTSFHKYISTFSDSVYNR